MSLITQGGVRKGKRESTVVAFSNKVRLLNCRSLKSPFLNFPHEFTISMNIKKTPISLSRTIRRTFSIW